MTSSQFDMIIKSTTETIITALLESDDLMKIHSSEGKSNIAKGLLETLIP
jgi:hypothetical protein